MAQKPGTSSTSVMDQLFQTMFKFLLWLIGVLLFFQAMIKIYGQTVFIVLFILTVIVCLRLKKWPSRIAAAVCVFLILPVLLTYIWRNTSPLVLFLALPLLSVSAYFIRESRLQRKPAPIKRQGAERTAVFPPGSEQT